MRENVNKMNIEGKIYQFDLTEKVTGENSKNPGTPFISGTVDVAIDSTQENQVQVHYTYVTPTYASGKTNATYTALKQIIDSGKTIFHDGYEAATCVRLNPSYSVNDWFPQGKEESAETPRNEGGFVTIVTEGALSPEGDAKRNKFTLDVVIYNVAEIVPEEGDSYFEIKAYTFDFRNAVLPITLIARNKDAGEYFMNLEASKENPAYTRVWGKIVNRVIKIEKVQESAFGPADVDVATRRIKEYVITGANPTVYEFDTEATMTAKELEKALQDRAIYLAEVKKRAEEYRASQSNATATNASPAQQAAAVKPGGFNF